MKETKFKYTEIGYIPNDWEVSKWGDVLTTFSSGATPFRGNLDYYKGNNLWISSGELNYNVITETIEHISAKAIQETNLRVHKPNTFLMAITGLEAPGTRGRCAFVGKPACTNQSCLAINSTNKMIVEYLFWFYRAYSDYLAFKYCQGSKQQSYTAEIVKKLPIIVPPLPEQHRIAAALSDIDTLIQKLEILIQKKQNIKQGAMQSLLTGKKRLKGFEGEWCEKKLGEIIKIGHGKDYKHLGYGEIPVYGTGGYMTSVNDYLYDGETVCIGRKGTIDKPLYYNGKIWTVDTLFYTYDFKGVIPKYLYYLFGLIDWLSLNEASGVPSLTSKNIEDITVSLPPTLGEQCAISKILSDMDSDISKLEAKKLKYTAIKQGMMQQLLTGKIRLTE